MSFAWPHLFWLLLVPAALLAWEIFRTQRATANRHPKILAAEAGAKSLRLSPFNLQLSTRAARPRVLLALGLACAVVALTRPQWGRIDEPVFDQSREILIAVDLSRSMLATDVKPSRLERSKLLIRSLLEKLDGERIGLVVFSGTAFLQSPLSADYEILREFLPALGPDYLPEGGTNYHALLETSLAAFGSGTAADRFLIILSDGEATDDDWKPLVSDLKKKDIRVISLGVGTEAGSMIPDGAGGFVKDDRGAVVLSRLNSSTLRELAQATGGTYRDASAWLDLAGVLQSTVEAGRKGEFMEKNTIRLVERFQWALAPALLFLFLSFWREFPVRPRPRELKLSDPRPESVPTASAASTAAKAAIAALVLSVLSVPFSTRAAPAIATPAAPRSAPPATSAPAEQLSPLGKIVTRLAEKSDRTGRDWAELARETVTWGQKLQTSQQPVPEGPVRDALAAVDLGSALDAKTADWPKLRSELEALLQKPEQQNQDKQQPPPQKNDQDKDQQQKQDQKQQNQNSQDQKSDQQQQQNQPQSQSDQQKSDQQKSDQPKSDQEKAGQPKQDSAFGDMQQDKQPPPPQPQPGETQKVGGAPEKKEGDPKDAADPALAMPLQKLDQLRNQDSPAKLFRLMEGDKKPTPGKKGKDW